MVCIIFPLDSTGLEPVRFNLNSLMAEIQVHHVIVTRSCGKSKKAEPDKRTRGRDGGRSVTLEGKQMAHQSKVI